MITPDQIDQTYYRTIPVQAKQFHEPFEVQTLDGIVGGNAADYVILDQGHMIVVAKDVFEAETSGASYEDRS